MINLFKFVIGTVLGSFVTLSSLRSTRHESVIFPPSHCDRCGHRLAPWELIPIISFLLLRGKCYQCHQPIGFTTLIGETAGGVIILINNLSITGILEIIFEFTLLFIAERDYQNYLIPVIALVNLLLITILIDLINHQFKLTTWALMILIYTVTLFLNSRFHFIGNGDVDLIFLFFLRLGFQTLILIILISSATAIVICLIHHPRLRIPYAPYLTLAYLLLQIM